MQRQTHTKNTNNTLFDQRPSQCSCSSETTNRSNDYTANVIIIFYICFQSLMYISFFILSCRHLYYCESFSIFHDNNTTVCPLVNNTRTSRRRRQQPIHCWHFCSLNPLFLYKIKCLFSFCIQLNTVTFSSKHEKHELCDVIVFGSTGLTWEYCCSEADAKGKKGKSRGDAGD